MKKIITVSVFSVIIACMFLYSCSDDDSSTGPGTSDAYINATITHWGFDFSAAKNDTTNWGENNDGETIGWTVGIPNDFNHLLEILRGA